MNSVDAFYSSDALQPFFTELYIIFLVDYIELSPLCESLIKFIFFVETVIFRKVSVYFERKEGGKIFNVVQDRKMQKGFFFFIFLWHLSKTTSI